MLRRKESTKREIDNGEKCRGDLAGYFLESSIEMASKL